MDYIFRWMGSRFLSKEDRDALGILGGVVVAELPEDAAPRADLPDFVTAGDGSLRGRVPARSLDLLRGRGRGPAGRLLRSNGSATLRDGSRVPGDPRAGSANGNGSVIASLGAGQRVAFSVSADSPSCMDCGSIMVRNGSCYKCLNCGATSGCS